MPEGAHDVQLLLRTGVDSNSGDFGSCRDLYEGPRGRARTGEGEGGSVGVVSSGVQMCVGCVGDWGAEGDEGVVLVACKVQRDSGCRYLGACLPRGSQRERSRRPRLETGAATTLQWKQCAALRAPLVCVLSFWPARFAACVLSMAGRGWAPAGGSRLPPARRVYGNEATSEAPNPLLLGSIVQMAGTGLCSRAPLYMRGTLKQPPPTVAESATINTPCQLSKPTSQPPPVQSPGREVSMDRGAE